MEFDVLYEVWFLLKFVLGSSNSKVGTGITENIFDNQSIKSHLPEPVPKRQKKA